MKARLNCAAASPKGFQAMLQLQAHVDGCGLEFALLELIKMRVRIRKNKSGKAGCAFLFAPC